MDNSEKIRAFRYKNYMSKEGLARFMGMNVINVYRWENYKKPISPLWVQELKRKGVLGEGQARRRNGREP